ncbi:MAG: conjugative transfer signal peptidase TraF [Methylococcaceae bacterium]|nr:conjugative transfer signal peptidase TraF [Methylococcaceae bacterium]
MNNYKGLIFLGIFAAISLLMCGVFFTMGGIVNTGSSIPPGLYWKVDKPLAVGKTVVLCPANQPIFQQARKKGLIKEGTCPDNYDSLMLTIVGKRKDIVTINENGIFVNERLLPQSKPQLKDKDVQTIAMASLTQYELKENEVMLISGATENPFDSRYFGPIEVDQIDSVISPIF